VTGYFACPPEAWEALVAMLPAGACWPVEAVHADLRWWEDTIRCGRRVAGAKVTALPTARELGARWGRGKTWVAELIGKVDEQGQPDASAWVDREHVETSIAMLRAVHARARWGATDKKRTTGGRVADEAPRVNADISGSDGQEADNGRTNDGLLRASFSARVPQNTATPNEGGDARLAGDAPVSPAPSAAKPSPSPTPSPAPAKPAPAAATQRGPSPTGAAAHRASASTSTIALDDDGMLRLPGGLVVPADLPGLLHRASTVSRLQAAGIETSKELLRLDEHGRKFAPRTGQALWSAVADLLREHWPGVVLGCLAEPEVPAPQTTQPTARGSPRTWPSSKNTAALQQLANLRARISKEKNYEVE
jgi:hypothetical protein